jgi:Pyruvate/2-oxoacid:ferredoxin oxidoreductase gamma subunit
MVLLGALLERLECLDPATALAVIQTKTGKSALLEANRKALEEGRKFAQEFSQLQEACSPATV